MNAVEMIAKLSSGNPIKWSAEVSLQRDTAETDEETGTTSVDGTVYVHADDEIVFSQDFVALYPDFTQAEKIGIAFGDYVDPHDPERNSSEVWLDGTPEELDELDQAWFQEIQTCGMDEAIVDAAVDLFQELGIIQPAPL